MKKHRPEFRFHCIVWKEDGEWTVHNPDIGAFGVGPTRAAALADFVTAAKLMVGYIRSLGEKIPESRQIEVVSAEF